MKKVRINIEVPESLKDKARRLAKKADLTLSQWVRKLIRESK